MAGKAPTILMVEITGKFVACLTWDFPTATRSSWSRPCAATRRSGCSSCPRATTSIRRAPRLTLAPTIMSPSRSTPRNLLARDRAALRQQLAGEAERQTVAVCALVIDLLGRTVHRDGAEVHLTPKEWIMLAELAKAPGQVITHQHLLRTGWGAAQESQTEDLRVLMRLLRQKLEPDPSRPAMLINQPGVGYRLLGG